MAKPVVQQLLDLAIQVEKGEITEDEYQRRCDALTPPMTEDSAVVSPDAVGSPFAGMTLGQARVMNSAFAWLPVEVYGGRRDRGPHVYIFGGMVLPGMWITTPFKEVGDLRLHNAERVDDCYVERAGSSRVLSASLVRRFDVLATEPQYRICGACGARLPITAKVYDRASLSHQYWQGEWEWVHGFECRTCWYGT